MIAQLLPEGGPVLAAVSGGADSMALLHLIHRTGNPCGVAYFDHQTRQGASAADGEFVAEVAESLGLPFYAGGGDIAALAAQRGESFEMAARHARYAFLIETARTHGFTAVATGHHGDDQAETVLLRLLRGSSPSGLGGIPPRRVEGGVPIIRPLLTVFRDELRTWLASEALAWREDATNAEIDLLRNRVRHELLPGLARDFNPAIAAALSRLAWLQRQDESLLEPLVEVARTACEDGPGRVLRNPFRDLPVALQFRCMVHWIRSAGGRPDFDVVSRAVAFALKDSSGSQTDLGNGVALYLGGEHVVIAPRDLPEEREILVLPVPGVARGFGWIFRAELRDVLPAEPLAAYCNPGRQIFDADAVAGDILIRRRREGDRIQPLGMSGTKKLKAIYGELGLTRPERGRQIVVEHGDRILWVPGYGVSRDGAVTGATRRYVELILEGAPPE